MQAMCHIAWQGPMHVGHMACHVRGTWQAMCHHAWPFWNLYIGGGPIQLMGAQIECVGGAVRRRRKKGKEKGRRGKEKGRKGKEKGRKRKEKERRKEKKKGEEERKKREEKEGVLCSEKTGRQRTRNCATRGRFPHTLVILRLGAV